ncbi:MAG: hypothetical protein QOH21_2246 [Acidobacteriota bacterium]|nr:hypothetical protein [Acidobacteriota bacterium]
MRLFRTVALLLSLAIVASSMAAGVPLRVRALDSAGPEGDAGTKTLTFTYRIPGPINVPVTGNYHTVDGTATAADNDYLPVTQGSFTIPAGQTESTPVSVQIVGDRKVEANETFSIIADNVQNAQTPPPNVITLLNDDAAVYAVLSPRVNEGDTGTTAMPFEVTITPAPAIPVQVFYITQDGSATASVDFIPAQGTITFAPGQASQIVNVQIIGDTVLEPDETFSLLVPAPPIVNSRRGALATGTGTIVNDDAGPANAVRILSGVGQAGRFGQPLPEPLVVQVLDEAGRPVRGVTVTWAVTGGIALLNPTTSITGDIGRAATTVTLNSVGLIVITATVQGLPPVIFRFNSQTSLESRADGPVAVPIAGVLDQICARNEQSFDEVCRALAGLPDGQVTSTLEKVAPQQSGAQSKVASEVIGVVTSGIGARLSALRSGERFSVQRLTFDHDGQAIPVGMIAQNLFAHSTSGAILSDGGSGLLFAQADQTASDAGGSGDDDYNGWSAFLSGNVGSGERVTHPGELGFDLKARGLMFGVDRQFGDNVFGASLNLMQLDSDLDDDVGSVDTSGYALSVYGSRGGLFAGNGPAAGEGMHYDGIHVEGSLTIGRNSYESEHLVEIAPLPVQRAESDNDATLFGLSAVTGIEAHRGRTEFDVSLAGTWSRASIDDMTESGSGPLILFVQGHDVESLSATGSFNLRSAFAVPFGTLIPSFRAEMVHEFRSGARLVTAHFLRDTLATSFTIPIDRADSNYGRLGAGVQAAFPYGWTAFVEVSQDVLRSDLHFRTLQFNVMKSF